MNSSDNAFFEEYKHLDKLCTEMYSCRSGISEYIAEMESKAHFGQRWVSSWNSDYKMLNHIRWVRNQIAHDSSAYQISKPGDLQFVQEYYERIITGQDSLALLQKVTKAKTRDAKQQKHKVHSANNSSSEPLPPKMNAKKGVLGCVAALIIVSGIILLLCITR